MSQRQESKYEEFKVPGHEVTIPILLLQGKRYMEVAQRLVWFNLEKQDWTIETELEKEWEIKKSLVARVKCTIKDPSGRVMRIARKTKEIIQDKDYEACETGAVGRALAFLGYGAAMAKDIEESHEDLADAPVAALKKTTQQKAEEVSKKHNIPKTMKASAIATHPFSNTKVEDEASIFHGKTFSELFMIDKNAGFKWTMARHKDFVAGNETPWVVDYLVYAQDCGLELEK